MEKDSINRLKILGRGGIPDRVPVVLSLGGYCAKPLEITAREYFLNPSLALEANIWTRRLFRDDSSPSYSIPEGICWDFGGELIFPNELGKWPFAKKRPVTCKDDVAKLTLPNPFTAPAARMEMEFARLATKAGFGIGIMASSPFRQAAQLVGVDMLMKWMLREPELVHALCRIITEYTIKKAETYIQEFGQNISAMATYPIDSHDLISPKQFIEFSAPYIKELHQRLQSMGINRWKEHLCGHHKHNLWLWKNELNLPAHTTISVGTEIPIEQISDYFGADFIVAGNISTTHLAVSSPGEIYEETKELVLKMKNRAGGFILMPACSLTTAVPPANIVAMVQAADDYGWYEGA